MKAVKAVGTDGFLYWTLYSDTDTVKKCIADYYCHCHHSVRLWHDISPDDVGWRAWFNLMKERTRCLQNIKKFDARKAQRHTLAVIQGSFFIARMTKSVCWVPIKGGSLDKPLLSRNPLTKW